MPGGPSGQPTMSFDFEFFDGFDTYGRTGFRPVVAGVEDARSTLLAGDWTSVLAWGLGSSLAQVTCTVIDALGGTGNGLRVAQTGNVAGWAGGLSKTLPASCKRITVNLSAKVSLSSYFRQAIVFGDTGIDQFAVTIESSGQIGVRKGDGTSTTAIYGTLIATSNEAVSDGEQFHLDLDVEVDGSAGVVKAYLNGVATSLQATALDTQATANATANELRIVATGSNTVLGGSWIDVDHLNVRGYISGGGSAIIRTNMIVETQFPTGDYSIDFVFGAAVLGDDAARTTAVNTPGANQIVLRRFTPEADGTLDSITVLPETTNALAKFKAALYSDAAGVPDTLITDGVEVVGCTSGVELTGALVTPHAFTAGTPMWLAFYGDSAISLRLADDTLSGRRLARTYGSGAPGSAAAATAGLSDWLVFGNVSGVAADFWSVLNNDPFSGDLAYMTSSTPSDQDLFTFPILSSTPTTIYSVAVKAVMRRADAGARTVDLQTKSAATTGAGAQSGLALPTTWFTAASYFDTDPDTAAAWNASGVNLAKHGYKIAS
jgi:hypothetical protein